MLIIAIDGPAASGKGTLAKRIAAHYGLGCLDTGLLYRAVGRDVIKAGRSLEDEPAAAAAARSLDPASLDDPMLRLPDMGEAASVVAKFASVRAALLTLQRDFAAQAPGAVLDGRDIGTVVLPDADVKIFVTADVEVRAKRRHLELASRGEPVSYERTLEAIRERDQRDTARKDSPMRQAADAVRLDTTNLGIEQALAAAISIVEAKRTARRSG